MYTPETQFPPSNRRYACQEAEAIERRLCYSILVHESPAFESLDTVKCSSSCQVQNLFKLIPFLHWFADSTLTIWWSVVYR